MTLAFAVTIVAAGGAALAWLGYVRWKDHARPEPLWLMAATACGGAIAVALAAFGYDGVEATGVEVTWASMSDGWPEAIGVALVIGAVEELAKVAPVLLVAFLSRHFDELLDGAIYAACSAIGFSLVETGLHAWAGFTLSELWPRILAAPIAHAMFTAPMGLGVSAAYLLRSPLGLAVGAVVSIVAHAAYDLALARSGVPTIASAAIVAVLWAAFIALVPRLSRRGRIPRDAQPTTPTAPPT